MAAILKNFYNGNLCPIDRTFAHGKEAQKYKLLMKKQDELAAYIKNRLDEQGLEHFQAYCDLQIQLNIAEQEDMFVYAFRLGAHWYQEVFSPRTDGISAEDF
ncbi:MAG: DUF6809 family protein [Candidatus Fimenecus sp.]